MTEQPSTNAVLDVPRRCGDCGYELTALPADGLCPECGAAYRHDEIVLFGWNADLDINNPGRTLDVIVLLAVCAIYLLMGRSWLQKGNWVGAGSFFLLASLYVFRLWRSYDRRLQTGLPPHQVRFSRQGAGHRVGNGPVQIVPWGKRTKLHFRDKGEGRVAIECWSGSWVRCVLHFDIILQSNASAEEWRAKILERIRVVKGEV